MKLKSCHFVLFLFVMLLSVKASSETLPGLSIVTTNEFPYSFLQKEFDASKLHLISFHPKPLSQTTGHLAFTRSRNSAENLLRIFNQGLAELKEERYYDQFVIDLLAGKYSP